MLANKKNLFLNNIPCCWDKVISPRSQPIKGRAGPEDTVPRPTLPQGGTTLGDLVAPGGSAPAQHLCRCSPGWILSLSPVFSGDQVEWLGCPEAVLEGLGGWGAGHPHSLPFPSGRPQDDGFECTHLPQQRDLLRLKVNGVLIKGKLLLQFL